MIETNETKSLEPQNNKELIEAINLGDTQLAIMLAKIFCQNLKIDYYLWSGVTPHPERGDQIKQSKLLLIGFPDDIKNLDTERWRIFEKNLFHPRFRKHVREPEQIGTLIYDAGIKDNAWWGPAREELGGLFDFLDRMFDLNDKEKLLKLAEELTNEKISVLASEFMTLHVGAGDNKVTRDDVTGLDGEILSCPISHSRGVGLKYMATSVAEYLWMNIISANQIIKPI